VAIGGDWEGSVGCLLKRVFKGKVFCGVGVGMRL
jgi:hypothetical protein